MHHRYIAEICRPEFIYFPADSKGLALFASTLQAPEKLHIALGVLLQSFKVSQGNLNWYQSKAHTRLPISPPLYEHVTVSPLSLCDYFLSFSCYNDLVVANLFFFATLPTPVLLEALAREVPQVIGYESWCQKTRVPDIPDGRNCTIIVSSVLTHYQRVTERQTDRQIRRWHS